MFGLRQKLMFGFGGLLLILLTVSVLGIAVSQQHRTAMDKFLYENWRSVEYGEKMVEALNVLNDQARDLPADATAADLNAASAVALPSLKIFDDNVVAEDNNITLPHEDEIAGKLTALWSGTDLKTGAKVSSDNYRDNYLKLLDEKTTPDDRKAALAAVVRLSPQ